MYTQTKQDLKDRIAELEGQLQLNRQCVSGIKELCFNLQNNILTETGKRGHINGIIKLISLLK